MSNVKFKNGNYFDSSGIMHDNTLLDEILQQYLYFPTYYREITSKCKYNINNVATVDILNDHALILSGLYNITSIIGSPSTDVPNEWGLLITIKNTKTFDSMMDFQILLPQNTKCFFIRTMSSKRWYLFNSDKNIAPKTE